MVKCVIVYTKKTRLPENIQDRDCTENNAVANDIICVSLLMETNTCSYSHFIENLSLK